MKINLLTLLFLSCFAVLCFTVEAKAQKVNSQTIKKMIEAAPEQKNSFTGFALYDLSEKKKIAEYNSDKLFIPASNTKLYTFYAATRILGDTLPALKYFIENDTLFFTGTGDPSFLNFDIHIYNPTYDFLAKAKETLCYFEGAFTSEAYGKGWAWDDYNEYYSPERSNFPIYGNIIRFKGNDEGNYSFLPEYLKTFFHVNEITEKKYSKVQRAGFENNFEYFHKPFRNFEQDIPFKTSTKLFLELLSDTLKRRVAFAETDTRLLKKLKTAKVFKSIPSDTLYKQMLKVSDNFMAEQTLLMCSSTLSDSLDVDIAIKYAQKNLILDLPDGMRWVDGSGLSRYNLFTPRDFIYLIEKITQERNLEQLMDFLPAGGESGTLKNWYKADEAYVFAKTGTFSNNHNLSGFLKTKSGKILIFSFMNNHYLSSSSEIKKLMKRVLWYIHLNY